MAFTLQLQFGGLCLFVQQDDPDARGMFVLMPNMHDAGHAGHDMPSMDHVPMLVFDGKYAGEAGGGAELAMRLDGHVIPMRGLIATGARQPMPATIARVTTYAGGIPIAKRWTTDLVPRECLAARLELDLGVTVQTFGATGFLDVDYGGTTHRVEHAGQARITVAGLDDGVAPFTIGGVRLAPVDGTLILRFLNIFNGDLHPPIEPHPVGEPQHHFTGYYSLLVGRCGAPNGDLPTPRAADAAGPIPAFVDPVVCSLGTGCSESHPEDC